MPCQKGISMVRWVQKGDGIVQDTTHRANYHFDTHPVLGAVMMTALAIVCAVLVPQSDADDGSVPRWMAHFMQTMVVGIALGLTLKACHSVYLTKQGVELYFFGKLYRSLPWSDIVQVGLSRQYKHGKDLVLTPRGCPKYDGGVGYWYVSRNRWQLIVLHDTRQNLAAVQELYGNLDYNDDKPRWRFF